MGGEVGGDFFDVCCGGSELRCHAGPVRNRHAVASTTVHRSTDGRSRVYVRRNTSRISSYTSSVMIVHETSQGHPNAIEPHSETPFHKGISETFSGD